MSATSVGKKDFFDYISPLTKKYLRPLINFFRNMTLYSLIFYVSVFMLLTFLILHFSNMLIKAAVITFLILLGGVSKIYQRYTTMPMAFEFVMFSTVVSGYLYGSVVGGMVGILSFAISIYFSARYNLYVLPSFAVYFLAGVLTPLFGNVVYAGVLFSIIYVIVLTFVSLVFLGSNPASVAMYALTSLVWNVAKFIFIVPIIIGIFPKG